MFADPRWLLAALCAVVVFQFALDSGISETAIWIAAGLLLLRSQGCCCIRTWPRSLLALILLVVLVLAITWAASPELTDAKRSERLVKFLVLTVSTYCVAKTVPPRTLWRSAAAVIAAVILWQFAARHVTDSPYGEFQNPHYLAYFTLLLLPTLILIAWQFSRPYALGYVLLLLPAVDLVLNDHGKPLIPMLATGIAITITLLVVATAWRRWTAPLLTGIGLMVALFVAPLAVEFFIEDERSTIWADTLYMIASGSSAAWLIGNGLGSFGDHFVHFATAEIAYLTLPHNFVLEAVYELGLFVALVVIIAFTYLLVSAVRLTLVLDWPVLRALARCNLATLIIWLVFSFFAFSVSSAYTLYPLAFIIGAHLVLMERA